MHVKWPVRVKLESSVGYLEQKCHYLLSRCQQITDYRYKTPFYLNFDKEKGQYHEMQYLDHLPMSTNSQ